MGSAKGGSPAPVSVVIVTYDPAPEMLGECLDSLARSKAAPQEILVADNSRRHDAVEQLLGRAIPSGLGPIFLPQSSNLGYAAATNAGVAASSSELVLLLNPDAALEPEALGELCEAASQSSPRASGSNAASGFSSSTSSEELAATPALVAAA